MSIHLSFRTLSEQGQGMGLFSGFRSKRSGFSDRCVDRYLLPLTTRSAEAADLYQKGLDLIFGGWGGAIPLFEEAIKLDSEFAVAHLALAIAHFENSTPELGVEALKRAEALKGNCTRREKQQIVALSAQRCGKFEIAAKMMTDHLAEFPNDALVMDERSRSLFLNGGADRGKGVIAFMRELASAYPAYLDDWFFLAKHGFFLEEEGSIEEAEATVKRSLALNPKNAYAAHAQLHVFLRRGELRDAYAFLRLWIEGYDDHGRYYEHLWTHIALIELEWGKASLARRSYETHNRLHKKVGARYLTLADASGLAWRFFLYFDQPRGDFSTLPWVKDAAKLGSELTRSTRQPYFDVHAALAYAAQGDVKALCALIEFCEKDAGSAAASVRAVAEVARALLAFVSGQFAEATQLLAPHFSDGFECVGGSLTEKEPLEETYLLSLILSKRWSQAAQAGEKLLANRRSARLLLWMGKIKVALGEVEEATKNFAEARSIWEHSEESPHLRELEQELDRLKIRAEQ